MSLSAEQQFEVLAALPALEKRARSRAARRRKPELFDDYMQEAFLAFAEVLERWDPAKGSLAAFAWGRCLGRMQDLDRREARYVLCDDELIESAEPATGDAFGERAELKKAIGVRLAEIATRGPAAEDVELRPIAERIRELMRDLPERDQELLGAFLFEDRKRAEIAAQFGRELRTSNRLLAAALQRLREAILKHGLEEAIAEVIQLRPRPGGEVR